MLAALGERDQEIAASHPQPFDAKQCRIARRQALRVGASSLATGIVVAAAMWALFSRKW